jgi:hypothetical protein
MSWEIKLIQTEIWNLSFGLYLLNVVAWKAHFNEDPVENGQYHRTVTQLLPACHFPLPQVASTPLQG